MHIKIHRSSNEAGGSCIEIWNDKARIVIATGLTPVNDDDFRSRDELIQKEILPNIPSLYEGGSNTVLFINHSNKEHYRLLKYVHPSCPVWIGRTTYWLIRKKCEFLDEDFRLKKVHFLNYMDFIKIGDIEVHVCLMDQASFDDYSFFIQTSYFDLKTYKDITGNKLLFIFNSQHQEKKVFDFFLRKHNPLIDYLFLEGNSIGCNDENIVTEESVYEELIQTFQQIKGINLVFISEMDIARIDTVYRACRKCHKVFLIDFYTASVLKTINKKARDTIPFPSRENFQDVYVYYPSELLEITEKHKKEKEFINQFLHKKHVLFNFYLSDLDKTADRTVMLISPHIQSDLEKYLHRYSDGCFINSIREEHKQQGENRKFLNFIAEKGMKIKNLPATGHVDLSALKKTVETIKPKNIEYI